MEQIREAKIQGLLNPFLVGFEQIHGAVEMVQIERVRALNADVLTQPLLITVEFGAGCTGAVGHHGKKGAFDSEVAFAALELVRDDGGEAQALPQRFQDIERAIGPGIDQAPLGGVLHNRFGITFFEDTASELSQAFHRLGILSTAAIEENADLRALFMRIPHALDQLQMRDGGAISAFLTGFTQVHVRENKEAKSPMSSQIYKSMYLGFCRDVSMAIRISPTNSIRAILAYWLKCTCSCQSRVAAIAIPVLSLLWASAESPSAPISRRGIHNGAAYRIEVPADWNGKLVVFAHGYEGEGSGQGSLHTSPL